jgi:hypothetical protein
LIHKYVINALINVDSILKSMQDNFYIIVFILEYLLFIGLNSQQFSYLLYPSYSLPFDMPISPIVYPYYSNHLYPLSSHQINL